MTEESLRYYEERTSSAREIALLRIQSFEKTPSSCGIASEFVPLFQSATEEWFIAIKDGSISRDALVFKDELAELTVNWIEKIPNVETRVLLSVLRIHATISRIDPTLAEELGREGSHAIVKRIIRCPPLEGLTVSDDEDSILMVIQDVACDIVSSAGGSFPLKYSPFTRHEIGMRLPLVFEISSISSKNYSPEPVSRVLIHQVTTRQSEQKDVGFVMWPSAVVLSRYIARNPSLVEQKVVLELGAGCGLVGLLAADFSAKSVLVTDFNQTVIDNLKRNILLNNAQNTVEAAELDFCIQTGTNVDGWLDKHGNVQEQVDVILAADVICQPQDAVAVANTIHDALKPGGIAIAVSGTAKHRYGVERLEPEIERAGLKISMTCNVADLYNGELLDDGMEKTAGYVKGMAMSIFCVEKPRS